MAKMDNKGPAPGHSKDEGEDEHVNMYNAKGSPEESEIEDRKPGFKKGGRMRRRGGGMAMGKMDGERLDRRPRRAAGGKAGGSPYSSAAEGVMSEGESDAKGRGYEGTLKKPA